MIIRRLPRTRLARASHTPARSAHAPAPRVADGILCRYPLEVTKTKVQAFGGSSKTSNMGRGSAGNNSMWGALKQTYRTEGKWGLFAPYAPGWMAKMVDAGSFNFVFWFWFTVVSFVAERIGDNAGLDAMKGIIAAAINRLCTHPAENIASRMQTRLPDEPEEPYFAVAARICRESGVGGLWKGLGPAMILCINPTIDTFVYFRVRRAYLRWASARAGLAVVDVAGVAAFLLATFSKAIAATICCAFQPPPAGRRRRVDG